MRNTLKKKLESNIDELKNRLNQFKNTNLSREQVVTFILFLDSWIGEQLAQEVLVNDNQISLTAKEAEVFDHISNGFTNSEIASALGVSIKTIEYHVKNVLLKTHTSNRTEAISYLIKNNLLNK